LRFLRRTGIHFGGKRLARQECVICGTAMPDIGAASGDNSVTAAYYFPNLSVYDLRAADIGCFQ
jgi:hypothetical protein